MKRIFRRAILAASSLGVAGGIVLTAMPASAAPIPLESWGASATGPISFPPVAFALSFNTPGVASNANYTNVLTTGLIVDRASFTTGYSLVNSPIVQWDGVTGRATQVISWCHISRDATFGGATIFSGTLSVDGSVVYVAPRNPAPNTTLVFGGATITLNSQQVVGGRLVVAAVKVHDGPENLYLGVPVAWTRICNLARPVITGRRAGTSTRAPVRGPAPSACPGYPALPQAAR